MKPDREHEGDLKGFSVAKKTRAVIEKKIVDSLETHRRRSLVLRFQIQSINDSRAGSTDKVTMFQGSTRSLGCDMCICTPYAHLHVLSLFT